MTKHRKTSNSRLFVAAGALSCTAVLGGVFALNNHSSGKAQAGFIAEPVAATGSATSTPTTTSTTTTTSSTTPVVSTTFTPTAEISVVTPPPSRTQVAPTTPRARITRFTEPDPQVVQRANPVDRNDPLLPPGVQDSVVAPQPETPIVPVSMNPPAPVPAPTPARVDDLPVVVASDEEPESSSSEESTTSTTATTPAPSVSDGSLSSGLDPRPPTSTPLADGEPFPEEPSTPEGKEPPSTPETPVEGDTSDADASDDKDVVVDDAKTGEDSEKPTTAPAPAPATDEEAEAPDAEPTEAEETDVEEDAEDSELAGEQDNDAAADTVVEEDSAPLVVDDLEADN